MANKSEILVGEEHPFGPGIDDGYAAFPVTTEDYQMLPRLYREALANLDYVGDEVLVGVASSGDAVFNLATSTAQSPDKLVLFDFNQRCLDVVAYKLALVRATQNPVEVLAGVLPFEVAKYIGVTQEAYHHGLQHLDAYSRVQRLFYEPRFGYVAKRDLGGIRRGLDLVGYKKEQRVRIEEVFTQNHLFRPEGGRGQWLHIPYGAVQLLIGAVTNPDHWLYLGEGGGEKLTRLATVEAELVYTRVGEMDKLPLFAAELAGRVRCLHLANLMKHLGKDEAMAARRVLEGMRSPRGMMVSFEEGGFRMGYTGPRLVEWAEIVADLVLAERFMLPGMQGE